MKISELMENLEQYSEAQQIAIKLAGEDKELLEQIIGEDIED